MSNLIARLEKSNLWTRLNKRETALLRKVIEFIVDIEVELSTHKGIFKKHMNEMNVIISKTMGRDAKRVKKLEGAVKKLKLITDIQEHRLNALRGENKQLTAKLLMLEEPDNE